MSPAQQGSPSSYLLIGAGCFGASTALHLKQTNPTAKVTLVDRTPFPCPSAAAHDLNKIIRAEYNDIFYMELALEAIESWKKDPIFSPHFKQTGILFATTNWQGSTITENYKKLIGKAPIELLAPENVEDEFDGILADADMRKVETCIWNAESGWGDAENALRSVIQAAVDLGVEYVPATVSRLSFDEAGGCTGAVTAEGSHLKADKVVLCTGATTAKLLADSAPDRPELQVKGRMVAAAAVMCAYRVPQDQLSKFKSAPIAIKALGGLPGK